MTDFNGRPVLVTGASGGIGGATVRQLVAAGADVIASGRPRTSSSKRSPRRPAAARCPSTSTREESVRDALDGLDV